MSKENKVLVELIGIVASNETTWFKDKEVCIRKVVPQGGVLSPLLSHRTGFMRNGNIRG